MDNIRIIRNAYDTLTTGTYVSWRKSTSLPKYDDEYGTIIVYDSRLEMGSVVYVIGNPVEVGIISTDVERIYKELKALAGSVDLDIR